jgi:DNA-binding response OmpR family regulator
MTGTGTRVLVADDEPGMRAVMVGALRAAGYDAVEAVDDAAASRLIEDPGGLRMVVTDIGMPRFHEFDVAIRARERDPDVPILFVTEQTDRVTDRATSAPCYCLSKPFTAGVLVEVVNRMLTPASGR